jgi:type IX secretion system PorP/SprF family membrane protein
MKNFTIASSLLILSGTACLGQDIHFSQFYEAPTMMNPALTGVYHATRASAHYKDQWRSVTVPYTTVGGSFEMRFNTNEWERISSRTEVYKLARKRVSGGFSFFSDKAGDGNMGLTQLQLSVSSSIPVSARSVLVGGLAGGITQRSINYSKLIFPTQYNGTGYDSNAESGENFSGGNSYYGDFAGGLVWSYKKGETSIRGNDQTKVTLGLSVFHFNKPKYSYLSSGSERLFARFMIHGQFEKGIDNTNVSLVPAFMFALQGPTKELLAGGMVKFKLKEDTKYTGYIKGSNFCLGAYYRNRDAVIAQVMMEFGSYGIGFSYDLNVSKLNTASGGRGGFEVMIKYVTPNPFLYQSSPRI